MSKKARLAKAQRRKDRKVLFYSHKLTLDKIQEAINEMFSKIINRPKHPLETIIVLFDPYIQKDVIIDTGRKINGKKLVLMPLSIKDNFEKMEIEIGIRVPRLGEDIGYISPLSNINIEPYIKEIEILQQQIFEITSVPKCFFVNHDTICEQDY